MERVTGPASAAVPCEPEARPTARERVRRAWARSIESARNPNARGWYIGACFGIAYQAISLYWIWAEGGSLLNRVVATALFVPLLAGFVFVPPLLWWAGLRTRLIAVTVYFAYTFVFLPLVGNWTFWFWVLPAIVVTVLIEEFAIVAPVVLALAATPIVYGVLTGFQDSSVYASIVIFSISSMMYAMNQQIRSVRELRAAQSEVARLAVVEERARFSRDMHDVLGHSLTVVTVKSELARRLVRLDPEAAETEIADIERLTRSALADLRSAVAGYREMSLSTELAVAQASLSAANVRAHLPNNAELVDPRFRELFGWVLREGVTNVIRHSRAENCWVEVTSTSLRIEDDGAASLPQPDAEVGGNGLRGLAQRAHEQGAAVAFGPRSDRGFYLDVREEAA